MMKRHLAWVLLPVLSLTAGCKDPNPNEIIDKATKKTGVPFFLWAYADDACVVRDVKEMWKEYRDLSGKQRKAFNAKLKATFDAVIINGTEDVGPVTGAMTQLKLMNGSQLVASKVISDTRTTPTGKFPGTVVAKTHELSITPSSAQDQSLLITYVTADRDVYQHLTAEAQPQAALDAYVHAGRAHLVSSARSTTSNAQNCGATPTLNDLF